jgi:hypothetical protein
VATSEVLGTLGSNCEVMLVMLPVTPGDYHSLSVLNARMKYGVVTRPMTSTSPDFVLSLGEHRLCT